MKKQYYFQLACVGLFLFLLQSCKIEEEGMFPDSQKSLQNDGYLPLAPSNNWVYDNWAAVKQPDGTFEYTGKAIETEHDILTSKLYQNTVTGNRHDYGFSPLDIGRTIGGFFGNFNQITKIGDKYKKKSVIRIETLNKNGTVNTDLKYELDSEDQYFLTDNPTSGELISSEKGSYGDSLKTGIYFEYEVKSYALEILPKMDPKLANQEGIDKHLENYENVLHTVDSVKITKLFSNSEGGVLLNFKGKVTLAPPIGINEENYESSIIESRVVGQAELIGGPVSLFGYTLLPVPLPILGQVGLRGGSGSGFYNDYLKSDLKLGLTLCPAEIDLAINKRMEGSRLNFISNQALYSVDQYWVKGVGNIKNITSPAKFNPKISISIGGDDTAKTDPIELKPTDPTCSNNVNTIQLALKLNSAPAIGKIEIPITLGNKSYVQNLKKYSIRKSLN